MLPNKTPIGPAIHINVRFLGAFLFTVIAWWAWPENDEGWRFAPLSIILGIAAIGQLIDALATMAKVYRREKDIADLMAKARTASSSELASGDALKDAGMIND